MVINWDGNCFFSFLFKNQLIGKGMRKWTTLKNAELISGKMKNMLANWLITINHQPSSFLTVVLVMICKSTPTDKVVLVLGWSEKNGIQHYYQITYKNTNTIKLDTGYKGRMDLGYGR